MSEAIEYLSEGDTFRRRYGVRVSDRGDLAYTTETVGPKCDETRGRWFCTTCGEGFEHNWGRDAHVQHEPSEHKLIWHCMLHGPEVP